MNGLLLVAVILLAIAILYALRRRG